MIMPLVSVVGGAAASSSSRSEMAWQNGDKRSGGTGIVWASAVSASVESGEAGSPPGEQPDAKPAGAGGATPSHAVVSRALMASSVAGGRRNSWSTTGGEQVAAEHRAEGRQQTDRAADRQRDLAVAELVNRRRRPAREHQDEFDEQRHLIRGARVGDVDLRQIPQPGQDDDRERR